MHLTTLSKYVSRRFHFRKGNETGLTIEHSSKTHIWKEKCMYKKCESKMIAKWCDAIMFDATDDGA